MEWISTVILILGLVGAMIFRKHLREAKLLRLREISHQERMAAMEHNLQLPEENVSKIDALLAESMGSPSSPSQINGAKVHWIRLTALALGLISLFSGIGAAFGIFFTSDPDLKGTWPMGLIPIFIGIGLLLFVCLSKRMAENITRKD